jgi:hypothetical protein
MVDRISEVKDSADIISNPAKRIVTNTGTFIDAKTPAFHNNDRIMTTIPVLLLIW